MTWQLYITIAILLLSVAILLQRIIMHRFRADEGAFAVVFQLLVAAAMFPFVLVHGISFRGFTDMWLPIAISTVGFGVGSVVYGKTLKRVDASAFSVLFATQAIWIMLAGVYLIHEHLSPLQLIGTVLILASVVLLAEDHKMFRNYRGVLYGLITGALFGIAIAASAYVVRHTDPLTWIWASFILGGVGSWLADPGSGAPYRRLFHGKAFHFVLMAVAVYALGNVAMNFAYIDGPFSLVAPIRQAGIVVTALLAFALMRSERKYIVRKLVAAAICTTGVVLLVV